MDAGANGLLRDVSARGLRTLAAVLVSAALAGSAFVSAGLTPGRPGVSRAHATVAGPETELAAVRPSTALPLAATAWPSYLYGPGHTSYSPSQRAISPTNAARLILRWLFKPGAPYLASPAVADGSVFIGSATGWFYKLSEGTGQVQAKAFIGRQPQLTCPAMGVASSATVARNSHGVLTVYVGGGNGYLYALRASSLRQEWRSVVGLSPPRINSFYDWSSPTVANGRVYIGIASGCDRPLVRGGLVAFSQATGRRSAGYFTVPAGARNAGASVWSSIGIGPDGDVYATTGNGPAARPRLDGAESILRLNPVSLRLLAAFKVPQRQVVFDGDFGGSPVFFDGMVGACNKNGIFYAVNQVTMRLVWWKRIANPDGGAVRCLAAPAYNGTALYLGGATTTLSGTIYPGSVQARLASTGVLQWEIGMPGAVLGSPALDGAALLTAGTYSGPTAGVSLINVMTGLVVRALPVGADFAQAVFANSRLFCATATGVMAWGLP